MSSTRIEFRCRQCAFRPLARLGGGTLGSIRVSGEQQWARDLPDIGTFLINPDLGHYRLYVPHVLSSQILRYEPAADGSDQNAAISGLSPSTSWRYCEMNRK